MRITNLVLPFICISLFAACSKNQARGKVRSSTQVQGGQVTNDLVINEDFVKSTDDKSVRVNSALAGSLGIVRVDGKDAETLFNALAVDETSYPENEKNEENLARIGKNIECYRSKLRDSGNLEYSCVYYFDYKSGEAKVRRDDARIVRDASIDESLTVVSSTLSMNLAHRLGVPAASIHLSGENAQILYEGLEREEFDYEGRYVKDGKNIYCLNDVEKYECTIELNYRSGEALANEGY